MPTAEQMQKLIDPLFPGLMGIEIKEATQDKIVATMLVRPDLCTAGGVCHGGAYMAFADTIGAIGTVVNLPPTRAPRRSNPRPIFSAPPRSTPTSPPNRCPCIAASTTQVWQTTIKSEAGKVCAVVTQTQMVLPACQLSSDRVLDFCPRRARRPRKPHSRHIGRQYGPGPAGRKRVGNGHVRARRSPRSGGRLIVLVHPSALGPAIELGGQVRRTTSDPLDMLTPAAVRQAFPFWSSS